MKTVRQCPCCGSTEIRSHPAILAPFIAHRIFDWQPCHIKDTSGLRDIPSGEHHSVCNTLFCTVCDTLFLDMRFDDEEMKRLYTGYRNEDYTALRSHYEPDYEARQEKLVAGCGGEYVKGIEEYIRPFLGSRHPLTILDWGGDSGINTPFRESWHSIFIYDFNKEAVIPEDCIDIRKERSKGAFDLVVCSNVLEHVSVPSDVLLTIHDNYMGYGSLLFIEVPYEDVRFEDKLLWHEHVNAFSASGLQQLLHKTGFAVLSLVGVAIPWEGKMRPTFRMICERTA